jgi:hypothetical protein
MTSYVTYKHIGGGLYEPETVTFTEENGRAILDFAKSIFQDTLKIYTDIMITTCLINTHRLVSTEPSMLEYALNIGFNKVLERVLGFYKSTRHQELVMPFKDLPGFEIKNVLKRPAAAPAVAEGSPAFDEEQDHLKSNVDTLLYVVNDRKLNDNQKLHHIHSYLNSEGYFCNAVFECLAAQTHFNRNSNTFSQAPYWPDLVSALQTLKSTALGAASAASESSGAASVAAPAAAEPKTCSVSYTRTVDKIDISTDAEPTVAALAAAEPIIAAPVDPTPEPVVTRPPPAYTSWGKFDDW